MSSGPDAEERRHRRALLKAHHPDLGGDAEEFIRVVSALDGGGGQVAPAPTTPGDDVRFVRRPRGLRRVTAWYRRRRRPPRVR